MKTVFKQNIIKIGSLQNRGTITYTYTLSKKIIIYTHNSIVAKEEIRELNFIALRFTVHTYIEEFRNSVNVKLTSIKD